MKYNKLSIVLAAATILAGHANGAVILDPTLASGPGNVIDPTGGETVDQNFGTAQATLEARSDLRVLQDFTGFVADAVGNNIVSFTATTLPDIQFQFSGSFNDGAAGSASSTENFATSAGSAMRVRNSVTGTSTLTISFGTWDGSSFAGNQTVGAAGFTLTQLYGTRSGDVTFRDSFGTALVGASFGYSGQNEADGAGSGNHRDIYFGWDSTAQTTAEIGSITITFTDSSSPFQTGFDDLAFTTVIPEPSSVASVCWRSFAAAAPDFRLPFAGEHDSPNGKPARAVLPKCCRVVGWLFGVSLRDRPHAENFA